MSRVISFSVDNQFADELPISLENSMTSAVVVIPVSAPFIITILGC